MARGLLVGAARLARETGSLLRAIGETALGAGLAFVLGYNALAPGFASWRDEGLIPRPVPNAWLVQYGVERLSALYYFANVDRALFTRSLAQERRRATPSDGSGFEAAAEKGIARLRGPEPAFCLTKDAFAPELMARTGAVVVRRRLSTVLLANPTALTALGARDARPR